MVIIGAIRSEHIDNNLQSNSRTSFLLESPSACNCEETDSILTSVKANREMQLEPRQNNVSLEAVAFSTLLRCATVSEPMLLIYSLKSLADKSAGILSNCFRPVKPGVHTNDFAPIHGRRTRIHTAPEEDNTSNQQSTPQVLCEYGRGDRESGRNR